MAVAPCGTLYDPRRPPSDRYGTYSTVTSVSTTDHHDPTALAHTIARITAGIAVPTAYAVRPHGSPGTGHPPLRFRDHPSPSRDSSPEPGRVTRPSFRIRPGIWHSVTSGGMLGRG
ncbi:hypothetical protein GCM10010247_19800 [Streptomyces calvus]|nr:hypothetical protein GCM10010247_19800 [Streptomyces calvus]